MEALLDRIGQQPPVMDYVASELERLGYSWAYRVIQTAGTCIPTGLLTCIFPGFGRHMHWCVHIGLWRQWQGLAMLWHQSHDLSVVSRRPDADSIISNE